MGFIDLVRQSRQTLKLKFVRDTAWTGVSTVVLMASGLAINTLLLGRYGQAMYGNWIVAFTIYMLLHMVAVMGINNSVIKYVAEQADDRRHVAGVVTASLVIVLGLSLALALLAWAASPIVTRVYTSPEILTVYHILLLALPLFSVNKVLVGLLNGLRDMTSYAMFQAARYVLVLAGIIIVVAAGGRLVDCAWTIPAAEVLLLVGLLIRTRLPARLNLRAAGPWFRRHLHFGFLSSLHDVAVELYFRIDILIVGALMSEDMTGLYGYASYITKELTAFSILVQVNFNPIISKLWASGDRAALGDYMRRVRRNTYLMYVPIVLLVGVGYPLFILGFKSEMAVWDHFAAFYVLLASVLLFSGTSALLGVMAYTGHLGHQVRRSLYALLANTVGSLTLVPLVGIIGAAVSTLAAFLVVVVTTHAFIRRRLEIHLWP